MAQATFSIRMDKNLKKEFESLLEELGMSMSTAINIFARTVVREKRIPFEIVSNEEAKKRDRIRNLHLITEEYYKNGGKKLTLKEINEEISKARSEREK